MIKFVNDGNGIYTYDVKNQQNFALNKPTFAQYLQTVKENESAMKKKEILK